jgi:hypothetical protein
MMNKWEGRLVHNQEELVRYHVDVANFEDVAFPFSIEVGL